MTLTLTFTLPKEQTDANMALHGLDYYLALVDFSVKLRAWEKDEAESRSIFEVKQAFYEILADRGVEL